MVSGAGPWEHHPPWRWLPHSDMAQRFSTTGQLARRPRVSGPARGDARQCTPRSERGVTPIADAGAGPRKDTRQIAPGHRFSPAIQHPIQLAKTRRLRPSEPERTPLTPWSECGAASVAVLPRKKKEHWRCSGDLLPGPGRDPGGRRRRCEGAVRGGSLQHRLGDRCQQGGGGWSVHEENPEQSSEGRGGAARTRRGRAKESKARNHHSFQFTGKACLG